VDRAIEQTEALIAKQQRIKTGLMQDLLTHGIDEHGNLRSEQTHQFKDSLLGRIPAEWEVHPISKFGSRNRSWLRTGPFGSDLNTRHWTSHGVPVLTIGSLGEGEVIEGELLFVDESTSETLKGFRVSPGDIVFSRVADIGRSLVVRAHQDGWIISSNLMRISLDLARANPEFLYRNIAFNSAIRSQLRTTCNSGGRELVNGPILSGLLFPWPDISEQERIVLRLMSIDETGRILIRRLDKYMNIKTALMQDLLTGEKRITPLLTPAATH
jgi:type I restriction enzyme, S subunit